MLFYPAALPLSSQTLLYVAGVIRRHRKKAGSCWRKLNPGRQALLVLAYLRKGETYAGLAAGFGIGTATAWRYVTETVTLLAARSPLTDEVFNVACGVETSLKELATALLAAMDSDLPVEHGPERAVNGVTRRLADTSSTASRLGFKPELGLAEVTHDPRTNRMRAI